MLRKTWNATESIVGLLAAFVIGFLPPILMGFGSLPLLKNGKPLLAVLSLAGAVLAGCAAGYVAKLASRVVERKGSLWPADLPSSGESFQFPGTPADPPAPPLVVAMVSQLRPIPLPVRTILGLWWFAHFAMAVVAGHFSAQLVTHALAGRGAATLFVVGVALHFAFLFAANLYLLLAAAVMIRVESLWHDLWNYRIPIDLYLALGSTFVAQYLKL
jgi:hypothetical protein